MSSMMNTSSHLSFNDAQNEFLMNQLATDPMTKDLRSFLKQDETSPETNRNLPTGDVRSVCIDRSVSGIAPQKTSDVYEREIEYLKGQLMRSDSRSTTINSKTRAFEDSHTKWRFSNKLLVEYDAFSSPASSHRFAVLSLSSSEESRAFFSRLKERLIRVNSLVSEANTISSEMQRQTTYSAMLQIPASYLKPSQRVRLRARTKDSSVLNKPSHCRRRRICANRRCK